jgi:hypothetical protein
LPASDGQYSRVFNERGVRSHVEAHALYRVSCRITEGRKYDMRPVTAQSPRIAGIGLQPATPMNSAEEKFAQYTAPYYIRPLSDCIPEEVRFGYHVCLGTSPQFPTVWTDDLAWVVRITNELVKNSPHRVDFLHLPATVDAGRSFFAPLRDLKVGKAKVFIGVGHRDGRKAIPARAREFLPDFGISHYCG